MECFLKKKSFENKAYPNDCFFLSCYATCIQCRLDFRHLSSIFMVKVYVLYVTQSLFQWNLSRPLISYVDGYVSYVWQCRWFDSELQTIQMGFSNRNSIACYVHRCRLLLVIRKQSKNGTREKKNSLVYASLSKHFKKWIPTIIIIEMHNRVYM